MAESQLHGGTDYRAAAQLYIPKMGVLMDRRYHFGYFSGFHPSSWQASTGRLDSEPWTTGEYWTRIAQRLEAAKFDFLFFEDSLAVSRIPGGSMDADLKFALSAPKHDPLSLIPFIAAGTKHLGLVATASTTFSHPYSLARTLSTIDSLSGGRVGWNIVTSSEDEAAQNFGFATIPPKDDRYERADEFVSVAKKLWQSWEPTAIVRDTMSGVYTDSSKVHEVDHVGKHFTVRGPLNTAPSPQHVPVLAQAGSSDRGREFASVHAELVMLVPVGGPEAMRRFVDDVRSRMDAHGRSRVDYRIIFAQRVNITDDSALAPISDGSLKLALAQHSTHSGIDLLQFDLDLPLPGHISANGTSMLRDLQEACRAGKTLREAMTEHEGARGGDSPFSGSASTVARNVVDALEHSGADGFLFIASSIANDDYVDGIIDQLAPELQRIGAMRSEYQGSTFRENLFAF